MLPIFYYEVLVGPKELVRLVKKEAFLFIVIGISYNSEQAIFRCTNLFGECTFKKNEKKTLDEIT